MSIHRAITAYYGNGGPRGVMAGVGDLIIGVIYFIGLPRHLRVSSLDLLLDRQIKS